MEVQTKMCGSRVESRESRRKSVQVHKGYKGTLLIVQVHGSHWKLQEVSVDCGSERMPTEALGRIGSRWTLIASSY